MLLLSVSFCTDVFVGKGKAANHYIMVNISGLILMGCLESKRGDVFKLCYSISEKSEQATGNNIGHSSTNKYRYGCLKEIPISLHYSRF